MVVMLSCMFDFFLNHTMLIFHRVSPASQSLRKKKMFVFPSSWVLEMLNYIESVWKLSSEAQTDNYIWTKHLYPTAPTFPGQILLTFRSSVANRFRLVVCGKLGRVGLRHPEGGDISIGRYPANASGLWVKTYP